MLTWEEFDKESTGHDFTPAKIPNRDEKVKLNPVDGAEETRKPENLKESSADNILKAAADDLEELDVAAGLAELEGTATRVAVDDKAMINCRADLNQLVPFKYD
ncbi:MAG: ribonucleotide-diphosphate reductase subunit beta, partial [Gammaproteobacteria bacterium]|nr:ribonucleotide-diphosphate reductase subunit beta [Gammaproteobacteria bacterium]